jgi:hypothetical protein
VVGWEVILEGIFGSILFLKVKFVINVVEVHFWQQEELQPIKK